jgi:hypothetical protein
MIRGIRCAVAFLVCVTTFLGIYWLGGGEFERGPALANAVVAAGVGGAVSAVIAGVLGR